MHACILRFLIYLLLVIFFLKLHTAVILSSAFVETQRTQRTAALANYSVPNAGSHEV